MTGFDLSTAQNIYYGGNQVQSLYLGSTLIWTASQPQHDYSLDYFTIVSLEDNNNIYFNAPSLTIEISTDGGNTWTQKTSNNQTVITLGTLNTGDKMLVKGNNASYTVQVSELVRNTSGFASDKTVDLEGNIMSMIYGDNFAGQAAFNGGSYNFEALTWIASNYVLKIVNAENFILPATTLTSACYRQLFAYQTTLISAPYLPATTLPADCYAYLFDGCSLLSEVKCNAIVDQQGYQIDGTIYWLRDVAASGTLYANQQAVWRADSSSGCPVGWTITYM